MFYSKEKDEGSTSQQFLVRLWALSFYSFVTLMLIIPTRFQLERGLLLITIVVVSLPFVLFRWRLDKKVLLLSLVALSVSVFGLTNGLLSSAPGALSVSTIYLLWPILYVYLLGAPSTTAWIKWMYRSIFIAIAVCMLFALTVLVSGTLGLQEHVFPKIGFLDPGFGIYNGFTEFRLVNFTTVIYGFPLLFSFFYCRYAEMRTVQKIIVSLALITMMLLAICSGRRGFLLIIIVAPFLTFAICQMTRVRISAKQIVTLSMISVVLLIVVIAAAQYFLSINFIVMTENFISAFSNSEVSTGLRYTQADALWDRFTESPLYGVGLGSTASVVRSVTHPWSYELFYLALLMNVGILGFLLYASSVLCIGLLGVRISQRNEKFAKDFIPAFIALVCFLLISGTNPYLTKFDYLWVMFLPVGILNSYLLSRNHA